MTRRTSSQNILPVRLSDGGMSGMGAVETADDEPSPGILAAGAGRSRRLAAARVAAASGKLAHGVDGLVLRFVVGAGEQLADQTDGEKLNTTDQQGYAEKQQRPVGQHQAFVEENLADEGPDLDCATGAQSGETEQTEKLERPRRIIEQEFHADQIEQHADRARDAVIRFAALARNIRDRNLRDRCPGPARQRRNETVQLAVEIDLVQDFAAIGFERGAKVVQVHARKLGHQSIGDTAWELAAEQIVGALHAPAADDVVAFLHLFDEARNFRRIVLQIAVHRNDDLALRVIEAGFQRGGLAEITAEAHGENPGIVAGDLRKLAEGAVFAAVVDENDLKRLANRVHHIDDFDVKLRNAFELIIERDDDGVGDRAILGTHGFIVVHQLDGAVAGLGAGGAEEVNGWLVRMSLPPLEATTSSSAPGIRAW